MSEPVIAATVDDAAVQSKLQYQLRAALTTSMQLSSSLDSSKQVQELINNALKILGFAVDLETIKGNGRPSAQQQQTPDGQRAPTQGGKGKKRKQQDGSNVEAPAVVNQDSKKSKENAQGKQSAVCGTNQAEQQQQQDTSKRQKKQQAKQQQQQQPKQQKQKQSSKRDASAAAVSIRQKKRFAAQVKAAANLREQLTAAGVKVPSGAGYYQLVKLKKRAQKAQIADKPVEKNSADDQSTASKEGLSKASKKKIAQQQSKGSDQE